MTRSFWCIFARLEVTTVSVTSPVMFPPPNLQPPSLCLYLSSSACMVAGPLRGELSLPGKQLRLTRRGRGGEDEGANTPSPCPHFWGRKWRPVPPINIHLLLLFSLFLHLSTSSAKLMPSERGCCLARRSPSGQLTNWCCSCRGKPVGGRTLFWSQHSPWFLCQQGVWDLMEIKCRCYRDAKCENEGHCFYGLPSFSPTVRNTSETENWIVVALILECTNNVKLHYGKWRVTMFWEADPLLGTLFMPL